MNLEHEKSLICHRSQPHDPGKRTLTSDDGRFAIDARGGSLRAGSRTTALGLRQDGEASLPASAS